MYAFAFVKQDWMKKCQSGLQNIFPGFGHFWECPIPRTLTSNPKSGFSLIITNGWFHYYTELWYHYIPHLTILCFAAKNGYRNCCMLRFIILHRCILKLKLVSFFVLQTDILHPAEHPETGVFLVATVRQCVGKISEC